MLYEPCLADSVRAFIDGMYKIIDDDMLTLMADANLERAQSGDRYQFERNARDIRRDASRRKFDLGIYAARLDHDIRREIVWQIRLDQ